MFGDFKGPQPDGSPFGSMAQMAPVDPRESFRVPDGLDESLAVAIGIAGLAGWLPLTYQAHLRPGETVLVLGASGVVGPAAGGDQADDRPLSAQPIAPTAAAMTFALAGTGVPATKTLGVPLTPRSTARSVT